ncbi:MAG: serine protease [Roseinatronobacter sp.]
MRKWLGASVAAAALVWALGASAQEQRWLQIEAHRDLDAALAAAQSYVGRIQNIAGFQLPSNWYAIAAGPFDTDTEAFALRRDLRAAQVIPSDAFVSNGANFGAQVFPVGTERTTTPVAQTEPAVGAPPVPEPVAAPEPVVVAEPEPEPEETLREAQAAERALSRDERAAIQTALQWFGFYTQAIDAAFGPGTRRSIENWQRKQGVDVTGVLTTRQRLALLDAYQGELDALGMANVRDEDAGISIDLPLALVEFDRVEAPFVHYRAKDGSGVEVLLLSQAGNQTTLFGLYEILQSLEVIPLDGPRERRRDGFTITGATETARAHVTASLRNGAVKGFVLLWPAARDEQIARVLPMMEASFAGVSGTLPDSAGQPSIVGRTALLAGLSVRRPAYSRTGFYIDAKGTVLTSFDAVAQCGRVTLDEAYDARIVASDPALGVAVLEPAIPLVPLAFAQFAENPVPAGSAITVAGFSFEDALTRPVLTFGRLDEAAGLNGEANRVRLSAPVRAGDLGGAVFGPNGSVAALLLGQPEDPARQLPPEVNFAVPAADIRSFLSANRISSGTLRSDVALAPEVLTRVAGDLSVLVSCWK